MEITIRHGFKGQKNVWWGEGMEATVAKNGCCNSRGYCGSGRLLAVSTILEGKKAGDVSSCLSSFVGGICKWL